MSEIVSSLTSTFTLAFVVTSMFSLGLGMTFQEVIEPLKSPRLVGLTLAASFVILPLFALFLGQVLGLAEDLRIGLLLLSAVAGAPLAVKASQIARGDPELAVSLVALQVIATVVYLPFVLPLLLPGVAIDTVAVALPLVLQILLPLAVGLVMNARYDEEAEMAQPIMAEISNVSLAIMLVLNLTNVGQVLGFLGTGAIAATLLVIALGFGVGYLFGGADPASRRTLAIATAQRNYAAAFAIAGGSFAARPTVLLMLLAAALISLVLVMLVAGELGRRSRPEAGAAVPTREPIRPSHERPAA